MIELVYYSKVNPNLTSKEVYNILNTSKEYNYKNDITGCLLYRNDEFLQIIEGEKDKVLDLFDKIKKDKRHSNVRMLAIEPINYRMFLTWSMAFYQFGNEEVDNSLFTRDIGEFSEIMSRPNRVLDLFWVMSRHITEARYLV